MGVPERRDSTRRQAREIDAEVLEAKQGPRARASLGPRLETRMALGRWFCWARRHLCRHGGGWKDLSRHDALHGWPMTPNVQGNRRAAPVRTEDEPRSGPSG